MAGGIVAELAARLAVSGEAVHATAYRIMLARWSGSWHPPVRFATPAATAWLTSAIDPEAAFADLAKATESDLATGGQEAPPAGLAWAQLAFGAVTITGPAPELVMRVPAGPSGAGEVVFDSARLDPDRVAWMMRSQSALLAAALTEPTLAAADLPVVDTAELDGLTCSAAAPQTAFDTVEAMFRRWTRQTPDAIACRDQHRSWTYRELDDWATRVAYSLRSAGCRSGDLVPVAVGRHAGLMAALLGVLRAGATYVPLDLRNPAARNQMVLAQLNPRIAVVDAGTPPLSDAVAAIAVDDCLPDGTALPVPTTPAADTAYVIFTSGSTGQPKGVQVGQPALGHMMAAMQDVVGLRPGDVFLALTTPSFDIAALELFLPLCHGAIVEILPGEAAQDPCAIAARLNGGGIRLVQATPTMWRAVIEAGWRGDASVRVLCGGEELSADLAGMLRERAAQAWNVYGPTESTVWSTIAELTGPVEGRVPIGRCFAGERSYVVDERGHRLAPGMIGELLIGGSGVAQGYLHQPELTARRFAEDPYAGGGRIYRTGDLAEFRPDGTLQFHGRRDGQVKLRGHRIELEEIETVLRRGDGVVDAVVVIVHGDTPAESHLVAFVLTPPGTDADVRALLEACAEVLPAVMVPSAVQSVAAWPTTSSGKIDRTALRLIARPAVPADSDGDLPSPGLQTIVADSFGSVLGLDGLRTGADFFALGGHSLLANRVVARLREAGVQLSLRDLFEAPTVAQLAARVGPGTADTAVRPAGVADRESALSSGQERLWFQDQLGRSGAVQHIQAAYRLTGPLDPARLRDALTHVVARHEPLRTVFAEVNGRPVQRVLDEVPVELPVTVVDGDTLAERTVIAHELMRANLVEPFSLQSAPLWRGELFAVGDDQHLLYLCLHHICTDGWSMGLIAAESMAIYTALVSGRPPVLPPVAARYRDHAMAERARLGTPAYERELAAVTARLADFPPTSSILLDFARPERQDIAGGTVRAHLGVDVSEAVRRLARDTGATVHSVLLAAYAALLHRHGAGDRMIVASPDANRGRVDIENAVGVFVNTLPVPIIFDPEQPFGDLVRNVRDSTLDAMAAVCVPFERIVDALRLPRNLAALPLTQVAFVLQNVPMPAIALPGVDIEAVPLDTGTSMYDLRLVATERVDGIELQLDHATAIITAGTASMLLDRYVEALHLLRSGLAAAEQPLPIAAPAAVEPITSGRLVPPASTIPQLFQAALLADPVAAAVSCGDQVWTYTDLDQRSDAVAAALQAHGAGPGFVVGIMLERGLHLAAALLGVVKLGAAYVCLDHQFPAARIDFMLADAGCRVILSDAAELAGRTGLTVIDLDRVDPAGRPGAMPDAAPGDIAYVTYTSGSTGAPKGACIPHRAVAGFWRDVTFADFGPGTVFLGHSSVSWDVLTLEYWSMVLSGGRCHFVADGLTGPGDLDRHREQGGADTVWLTSAFFNAIVDADPSSLAGLRQVLIGGEAVSLRHIRAFRRVHPDIRLVNGYGPSECTVFTTCFVIPRRIPSPWASVPIGSPVGDRLVHVRDSAGRPVPALVPGELYVGGPAVALGYLNQPELSGEHFIRDGDDVLYRTGDLVRRRSDGLLEFLGRTDDQIKLRGYRIELGEIERALTGHPAVATAVVVLHTGEQGGARLAAYVTEAAARSEVDLADELRRHLRTRLPEFMVPGAIQVLAELPRRSTGKVDHDALPAPQWHITQTPAAGDTDGGGDGDERIGVLTGIWADVLGLDKVGPDDNFFEIGGDSISSIQVVVRAREAGILIEPRDLFDHQTVRSVLKTAGAGEAPQRDQATLSGEVPLGPVQHWMFDLRLQDVHRFPQSLLLDFDTDPGGDVLQRAFDAVVERHDMLRARFDLVDGCWTQRYGAPGESVPLTYVTLDPRRVTATQIDEVVAEAGAGIDITTGPLIRAVWIAGAGGGGSLFIVCHHLVIDGYSWNVVLGDLLQAIATPLAEPVVLAAKTSSFRDWVHALRSWAGSAAARRELDFWRGRRGRGIPWLAPASAPPAGRVLATTELAERAVTDLRQVSSYGAEPVELMVAALAQAVLAGTGQRELTVELEHHGRDTSAIDGKLVLDRTVGWFTSLYPVTVPAPDADADTVLKATMNALRRVPGSGQGHGVLRHLVGEDLPGRADVRFNYMGRFDALQASVDGVRLSRHSLASHVSAPADGGLALNVTAFTVAGRMHVRWDYRPDLISAEQMAALTARWAEQVGHLIGFCLSATHAAAVAADFPLAGVDQSVLDDLLKDLA